MREQEERIHLPVLRQRSVSSRASQHGCCRQGLVLSVGLPGSLPHRAQQHRVFRAWGSVSYGMVMPQTRLACRGPAGADQPQGHRQQDTGNGTPLVGSFGRKAFWSDLVTTLANRCLS